jgi:hypothetical protein
MENIIEILNSENAVEKAIKNPTAIYGFENDWTGEKYEKLYRFDINKYEFIEI